MRQRGPSARLKQISHWPIRSLTSVIAAASAAASRVVGAQDVEGEPLGGAVADPRQLRELGDEPRDRGREGVQKPGRPRPPRAPRSRPAVAPPIFWAASSCAARSPSLTAREHHVGEQLGVVGVDRGGVDADLLDDQRAAHAHADHAAAGRGLDLGRRQLLLRARHVGLHLLDLPEHLLHVGLGHQPSSSSLPGSSSAPNSSFKRATSSSSLSACGRRRTVPLAQLVAEA